GQVRLRPAHLAGGPRAGAMSPRPGDPSTAGPPPAGEPPGGRNPGASRSGGRDRHAAGRARNARPRDALGRPLPRGAPRDERSPDDLVLPPPQALQLAQQLLDAERPFHAHEVVEASWKAAPTAERDLWQGIPQTADGLTHPRHADAHLRPPPSRRGYRRHTW